MSEPEMVPMVPQRRGRSWFVGCTTVIVVFLALIAGLYLYARYQADQHLREAIAVIEAKGPRWRLADIEADRTEIPDEENTAHVMMAVRGMLPAGGFPPVDLDVPGQDIEPPHRLREKTAVHLQKELAKYPEAIQKARTLADMDRGRYPIAYAPDFISTLLPHVQQAREVAWLLHADSAQFAEQGDVDAALRSARAAMIASRSIGDEPLLISLLVRIACAAIASNSAVRALNQGEASEAELVALMALGQKEDREKLLQQAMRGERGGMHEAATMVEDGKLPMSAVLGGPGGSKLADRLMMLGRGTWLRHEHATLLELMTQQVEAVESPLHDHPAELSTVEQQLQTTKASGLARLLMPATAKVAQANQRHHAMLRNLIVLVAAERYRRANGRLPKSISDLVPAFLPDMPLDPFDGKPIRLRRTVEGITVYSVGPDRTDNSGHVNPKIALEVNSDLGFRLWDVDKRRQSAPPPPPPERPEGLPGPGGPELGPPM